MAGENKGQEGSIYYQKNGNSSFLVICSCQEPRLPYQINMIRYNQIESLIPVQFFIEDGEYKYFYDISCRKSLSEDMKNSKFRIGKIRTIMTRLYRCIQQLEEYLLDCDCLVLDPQYIFVETEGRQIQFCFYPDKSESFETSLEKLFDYFLNRLDYQDEKSVVMIYGMYQKAREERTPLYEMMKEFCEDPEEMQTMEGVEPSACGSQKIQDQRTPADQEADNNILGGLFFREQRNSRNSEKKWGEREKHTALPSHKAGDGYRNLFPYMPDLVGGLMIAVILWNLGKKHAEMSGVEMMLCLFVIAGILAGCGALSTFLSGICNKKDGQSDAVKRDNISKCHVRDYQKEFPESPIMEQSAEKKGKNWRNTERGGDRWENTERKRKNWKNTEREEDSWESTERKRKNWNNVERERGSRESTEGRAVKWKETDGKEHRWNTIEWREKSREECREKGRNPEKEKDFEEMTFTDEEMSEERKDKKPLYSIPATVVMKEAESFGSFHPVLISQKKTENPDIIIQDKCMTIGKIRGIADVCLTGESVSRIHAKLIQDAQGCAVVDIGSTNGTYINGFRISEQQKYYLEDGDKVRFAQAEYEFQVAREQGMDERRVSHQTNTENAHSHEISDVI